MNHEIEYEVMDVEDVRFLKQRIRELEEKVVELREYLHTENERIAKAREILEVTALDSESSWARMKAKEALDALEGK